MTDNFNIENRLALTVEEAIRAMGLGRSTGYKLVFSGEWPSVRIGQAIRIPVAGLRAWLEAKTQLQYREQNGKDDPSVEVGATN